MDSRVARRRHLQFLASWHSSLELQRRHFAVVTIVGEKDLYIDDGTVVAIFCRSQMDD